MCCDDNLYIFTVPPSASDIEKLKRRRDRLMSAVDFTDIDDLPMLMSQVKFINLFLGIYGI